MTEKQVKGDTRLVAASSATAAEVDGELVLLDVEQGVYYGLNPVGARLWELMQDPISVQALVDKIAEEYSVNRSRCHSDIVNIVQDLLHHGLVRAL